MEMIMICVVREYTESYSGKDRHNNLLNCSFLDKYAVFDELDFCIYNNVENSPFSRIWVRQTKNYSLILKLINFASRPHEHLQYDPAIFHPNTTLIDL